MTSREPRADAPPQPEATESYRAQPMQWSALDAAPGLQGDGRPAAAAGTVDLQLLMDVPMQVMVEVGRARLPLSEIMALGSGSIVALDKRDGDPVDLRVNGKLVARGEVVLIEDSYGIRVTEILDVVRQLARP